MTDIPTRLSALTQTDESGPLRKKLNSLSGRNFDNIREHAAKTGLECLDRMNEREDALIALVQEAAGEIALLHRDIVRYRAYLNLIAWPEQFEKGAKSLEVAQKLARETNRIAKELGHG